MTELAELTPGSTDKPADHVITSIAGPKRIGLILLFLVFGVFGSWAAIAPIDGQALAPGTVTVKSYKKIIQHLEGGIVSEIRVRDGDEVNAGDTLLILDNTQSLAQLEIINSQFVANTALVARLIAERDDLDSVIFPAVLRNGEYDASEEIEAQDQIFRARKISLEGSVEVLEQRIEQLQSSLVGQHALKASKEILAESYAEELEDITALLEEGFSDKTVLRSVERNHASLLGQAAELTANIASTEIQIGETRLQILQQDKEFRNEVIGQLAVSQTQLKDNQERMIALQDVVSRTIITAPASGIVNGMQVHTIGGVISPATPIVEIVPQAVELIIESRVSPMDIDRVAEGQEAMIRFSTFSAKTVPTLYGTVLNLSADSIVDQVTGIPYYLARIEVNPESMVNLGNQVLVPGMPAEVFINSGSRTFLQYLMKPLSNSMARALIED